MESEMQQEVPQEMQQEVPEKMPQEMQREGQREGRRRTQRGTPRRRTLPVSIQTVRLGSAGVLAAWLLLQLTSCAVPVPVSAPMPRVEAVVPPPANVEVPFDQAARQASDSLIAQIRRLSAFSADANSPDQAIPPHLVLDPMREASTGQRTAATRRLGQHVGARLSVGLRGVRILPLEGSNLADASYLLTGTLKRTPAGHPQDSLLLNLALTDLRTGAVVAQAWALSQGEGLDNTPLRYDAESPVRVPDRLAEGYVTTSASASGKPADGYYLERLAATAVVNQAVGLYDAGRDAEALARFQAADGMAGFDRLRVLNGLYLAHLKLGHEAEAERAFGELVGHGIANQQFDVKFSFQPGNTAFLPNGPRASRMYTMWLRQIARESNAAKVCLNIVGHTHRTGRTGRTDAEAEVTNQALSLQRASRIRQRLIGESRALAARTQAVGMGSRENTLGSSTDDAADALDRRVDFRIVPCG